MSQTDWEKKARELVKQIERDIWGGPPHSWNAGVTESAILQLGREMAAAAHAAEAALWSRVIGELEVQWRERMKIQEEAHIKELGRLETMYRQEARTAQERGRAEGAAERKP